MQHTIKTYRKVALLVCLGAAFSLAGCNAASKTSSADSLAKKDSVGPVKDSVTVAKKDSDSTSQKKAPAVMSGPAPHSLKQDSSAKTRPIVRKT